MAEVPALLATVELAQILEISEAEADPLTKLGDCPEPVVTLTIGRRGRTGA